MWLSWTTCRWKGGTSHTPSSLEVTQTDPGVKGGAPPRGHPNRPSSKTGPRSNGWPLFIHDWGEDQDRHAHDQISRQES